jgi:LEA14-like dessication related protein
MAERHIRRLWPALLAGALLAGCSLLEPEPIEPPVVNLLGLEPVAMGINSQVFKARLSLYNPNPSRLDVSGGEMQLDLAGVRAAKGRTMAPFAIAAGETSEVEVQVTMNMLRDLPALFAKLSTGGMAQALDYALEGHVDVARRGLDRIPISASGRLTMPDLAPLTSAPGPSAGDTE